MALQPKGTKPGNTAVTWTGWACHGGAREEPENGALTGQAQITFRGRKDKEIKSSLLHSLRKAGTLLPASVLAQYFLE